MLLDEVLSELDTTRQEALLQHLPEAQIIVTCTAIPESVRDRDNVHLLDLRLILPTSAPDDASAGKAAEIQRKATVPDAAVPALI